MIKPPVSWNVAFPSNEKLLYTHKCYTYTSQCYLYSLLLNWRPEYTINSPNVSQFCMSVRRGSYIICSGIGRIYVIFTKEKTFIAQSGYFHAWIKIKRKQEEYDFIEIHSFDCRNDICSNLFKGNHIQVERLSVSSTAQNNHIAIWRYKYNIITSNTFKKILLLQIIDSATLIHESNI